MKPKHPEALLSKITEYIADHNCPNAEQIFKSETLKRFWGYGLTLRELSNMGPSLVVDLGKAREHGNCTPNQIYNQYQVYKYLALSVSTSLA